MGNTEIKLLVTLIGMMITIITMDTYIQNIVYRINRNEDILPKNTKWGMWFLINIWSLVIVINYLL